MTGKTNTERRILFWFDNKTLEKYLSKYPIDQRNEIAKNLFADFINGHNTQITQLENTKHNTTPTTKEEHEKIKLGSDRLKLWKEIRKDGGTPDDFAKLVNHGEIPNLSEKCTEQTTGDHTPKVELKSYGTTTINKPKKILQEDGTLRCMRCNRVIPMRVYNFEQLDDYRDHVESSHGNLYESERKELMEIYPN